jgi:phage baseplate assembly protein W
MSDPNDPGPADFRGAGWRFPIQPRAGGSLGYVDGDDNISQSLVLLLSTITGERVMRPEFGSPVPDLIFQSDSEQNLSRLGQVLSDAVRQWEPRVEIESVRATRPAGPGDVRDEPVSIEVALTYRVLRTNTRRNLVFPYYLAGAGAVVEP